MSCWFTDYMNTWIYAHLIIGLGDDKVSMLTHAYPHKPLRKMKWPSTITRLTAPLCVAWCLIRWFSSKAKRMWSHKDTKFSYWDQLSLNNAKVISTQNSDSWNTCNSIAYHQASRWLQRREKMQFLFYWAIWLKGFPVSVVNCKMYCSLIADLQTPGSLVPCTNIGALW